MALRSIATGTVTFGLVAIPIKLYSATESATTIRFNTLHAECGTRLKQQLVCPKHDEVVKRDDTVKGYEFAKGQFVTFTKEELGAMGEKATHAIEIREFVPLEQVDPVYYSKAYFLGPNTGGDKPYKLLSEAMVRTGQAAVAQYSARGKQYLVLLRPYEGGVLMQQMHYADEIRDFGEVPVGDATLSEPELELAEKLIEQIATEAFDPKQYEDLVRKRMLEAIERKVQGQDITVAPEESQQAEVVDLMAALKASLGDMGERKPAKRAASKKKPAAKKKAKAS